MEFGRVVSKMAPRIVVLIDYLWVEIEELNRT